MPSLSRGSSSGIISRILAFSNINGLSPHPPFSAKAMTFGKWKQRRNRPPVSKSPVSFQRLVFHWRAISDTFWHTQALPRESADVGSKWWGRGLQRPPYRCLAARPGKTARHTTCHIQSVNSCLPTLHGEPPSTTHLLLPGMVKKFLPPWSL